MAENRKNKIRRKNITRVIKFCLVLLIAAASLVVIQGYGLYIKAITQVPLEQKVEEIRSSSEYISLVQVSDEFINGLVAVEDHRFYQHGAVDLTSLGRAVINNLKARDFAEGGSTITQQLAKNMYFSFEKTLTRKVAEVFVASDLEMNYKKEEILELYINIIYFGNGYYGVAEASRGYFDVKPKDLTLAQATLLAGLPKAPSIYTLDNNLDKALIRREAVLEAMVRHNYLDAEAASKVKDDV